MKDFLVIANGTVTISSLMGVIGSLLTANFGLAWLCAIPLAYGLCNLIDDLTN